MTDLKKVLQQALDALSCIEYGIYGITDGPSEDTTEAVINALNTALAEHYCDTHCTWLDHDPNCKFADPEQDQQQIRKD